MTTSGPNDPNDPRNSPPGYNPYEPMPTAPPVDPREGGGMAPARPKSVETSFKLWLISAGLSLLVFLLGMLLNGDQLREQARESLRQSGQALSPEQIDSAVTAALVFSGVVALAFFGLYLLFAFKMRAGRNWARIVLAVLGGLDLILTLVGLSGGGNVLALVLDIANLALVGGAIFLMFQRDSNEYFAAAGRRR